MTPEAPGRPAEGPAETEEELTRSPEAAQAAADRTPAEAEAPADREGPAETEEELTRSPEAAQAAADRSPAEAEPPGKRGRRSGGTKKKKRRPSVLRSLVRLLIKTGAAALLIWVLLTYVGGVYLCHTSDMYPALRDGDLVITFRLGEYHSGDVIVYEHEGKICFGRIIGEPGDEIYIGEAGEFTVNGTRPYETIFYNTASRDSDVMTYPYVVREGEYFVLADARELGADSRSFGPVRDLKGKAVLQLRRRGF